jgi:signal transduction histidine kinase
MLVLQKVAQQTLTAALAEIRRTFDGPVFDVLGEVTHPLLVKNQLDLVERLYARGLETYPQVDRFFIWRGTEASADGSHVLFYDRETALLARGASTDPLERFGLAPSMGQVVLAAARRHARTQRIYAAFDQDVDGTPYEFFIRTFYTDATRRRFFAVLGFAVDLRRARGALFETLTRGQLRTLLNPSDGSPQFELSVLDETGRRIFGPGSPPPGLAARAPLDLHFYPVNDIRTRMAATAPDKTWTLVLGPQAQSAAIPLASSRTQSYWLSGLSVLLIFVALGFALQVRTRASQLARMQADFVSHVSHQVRTPLSLLSAVTETMALDRVRSPEKLARCVDVVRVETARLSSLVERILEFSRVGDGARQFELEAVPLGRLVRETVESFATALTDTGFSLEVEEAGTPPIVVADPVALEQALVNLLDNAVKYSGDARDIKVRVSSAGNEAIIEVIDQGIGIDPAERTRLFERFYRGAGARLHRQGLGLGLAIVRELVVGQRGSIDVQSAPGAGATFRIRIPVLQAVEPQTGSSTPPAAWFRPGWLFGRFGSLRRSWHDDGK